MKTLTVLIVVLMAACGGGETDEKTTDLNATPLVEVSEDMVSTPASATSKVNASSQQVAEIQKKIVKTGGLAYHVTSIKDEYKRLKKLLDGHDAYIASEEESKEPDRISYRMTVKVPPQHFDSLVGLISQNIKAESKWIKSKDVTDRFYDLQLRIANKKKLEERYLKVLEKATNVRDVLEVERNLNVVRGEIETLQGQFKLLNHTINYSQLDLSFYELIPYEIAQETRPGYGSRLFNAISAGWQGFLTLLVYLLALWPFAIIAIGVAWFVKKIRAKKKLKKR